MKRTHLLFFVVLALSFGMAFHANAQAQNFEVKHTEVTLYKGVTDFLAGSLLDSQKQKSTIYLQSPLPTQTEERNLEIAQRALKQREFHTEDQKRFQGKCGATAQAIEKALQQLSSTGINHSQFSSETKSQYEAFIRKANGQSFNKVEIATEIQAFGIAKFFDKNAAKGGCSYSLRFIKDETRPDGNGSITNVAQISIDLKDIKNIDSQNSILTAIFRQPTSQANPAPVEDRSLTAPTAAGATQ